MPIFDVLSRTTPHSVGQSFRKSVVVVVIVYSVVVLPPRSTNISKIILYSVFSIFIQINTYVYVCTYINQFPSVADFY